MKKQIKIFDVPFEFNWFGGVEINKLKEDLESLEKLGATHVDIKATSNDQNWLSLVISANHRRIETDDEFAERINLYKNAVDEIKELELIQLRRLLKKYPDYSTDNQT